MKTNVKIISGYIYHYNSKLTAGYYSPVYGWHLLKSIGQLVYNYDELGKLFYNKI
jgi:hypothetical protein